MEERKLNHSKSYAHFFNLGAGYPKEEPLGRIIFNGEILHVSYDIAIFQVCSVLLQVIGREKAIGNFQPQLSPVLFSANFKHFNLFVLTQIPKD